jgi:hypothetical protein
MISLREKGCRPSTRSGDTPAPRFLRLKEKQAAWRVSRQWGRGGSCQRHATQKAPRSRSDFTDAHHCQRPLSSSSRRRAHAQRARGTRTGPMHLPACSRIDATGCATLRPPHGVRSSQRIPLKCMGPVLVPLVPYRALAAPG